MANIFQIGGIVSGESFIGRKSLLKSFKQCFLNSNSKACKAIIGLPRSGKSSFVCKVFEEIPSDVIYIYEDLKEWSSYAELWADISLTIESFLKNHKVSHAELDSCLNVMTTNLLWPKFLRSVKNAFEILKELKYKVILVLDEFDHAQTIFTDTKHFELFRTLFSSNKFNISAITISRRNLYVIESTTYQSSTFHGVLDTIYFKGFDNEDLLEYYNVFIDNNVNLTSQNKLHIEYYAGHSPFLLSIIGYYILDQFNKSDIEIPYVFKNKCKSINDYYRDCIKHLERDKQLKKLLPFVTGPNLNVTNQDKDELINLGYLYAHNDEYLSISEYFKEFLEKFCINKPLWQEIKDLETIVKILIYTELPSLFNKYGTLNTNINTNLRTVLFKNNIKGVELEKYERFINNTKQNFDVDSTFFDVLSLRDSFIIVKNSWDDIFKKYFNNEIIYKWDSKFFLCARARNPVAHFHEDYITESDKKLVDIYSKEIIETLVSSGLSFNTSIQSLIDNFSATSVDAGSCSTVPHNNVKGNSETQTFVNTNVSVQIQTPIVTHNQNKSFNIPTINTCIDIIGTEVLVKITKVGIKNLNLRGIFNNNRECVIPKSYLHEVVNLRSYIGREILCRVKTDERICQVEPLQSLTDK